MRVSGRRFALMTAAVAIAVASIGVAAAAPPSVDDLQSDGIAYSVAVIVLVLIAYALSRVAPRLRNEPYLRTPHGYW